jgi:hypothetical protein
LEAINQNFNKLISSPNYKKINENVNPEDSQYVLKHGLQLDILYYLEYKIFPKINIFLAPLIHSYKDYPRIPFGATKLEKKKIKSQQKAIETKQKDSAYEILLSGTIRKEIENIQKYRLQRVMLDSMIKSNKFNIPEYIIQKCIHCNILYESKFDSIQKDPHKFHAFLNESIDNIGFYDLCPDCSKLKKDEIMGKYTSSIKAIDQKLEKCENTCWTCIEMTQVSIRSSKMSLKSDNAQNVKFGKPDYFLEPSECTMSTCETYKEKRGLIYNQTKCNQKHNLLKNLDW